MQLDYIKEIRRLVSVQDVADRYGVETNAKGFTRCIFHSERTASLKIYPNNRGFYCFGCGQRGDSIDFVAKLLNITAEESAKKINTDFGLNLPVDGRELSYREKERIGRYLCEQRKKREQAEKDRQRLLDEWVSAYSAWITLDKLRRKFKPTTPGEEPHPLWVTAIKNLDRVESELEEIETRRWKNDRK